MEKVSVLAITKNGINIGEKLKELFPNWDIFVPNKLSNENKSITWYSEPTSDKIIELFKNSNALICLFSLGAVIRLIAPYLKDKKTDPAVIVIDDKTNFVISVLSGHIGGANELTQEISEKLNALPVITTAADVNKTIAVDLVGREFGWKIDDETTVTKISAHMVNAEPIGVFQQTGNKKWYKKLPKNVTIYNSLEELKKSNSKAHLIISDTINDMVWSVGNILEEEVPEGSDEHTCNRKISEWGLDQIGKIKVPPDYKTAIPGRLRRTFLTYCII